MSKTTMVFIFGIVLFTYGATISFAYANDEAITSKVRQTLDQEGITGSSKIKATTTDGVVTLTGNVGGHEEAGRVVKLVSTVEGVKGVQLNLFVRGSQESLSMEKDATTGEMQKSDMDRGAGTITATDKAREKASKEVVSRFDQAKNEMKSDVNVEQHKTASQESAMNTEKQSAKTIDVQQITTNTDQYVGKTVTIRAYPDRVINPHVFTVDENNNKTGADLIVLIKNPRTSVGTTDGQLTITGTLKRYVETEFVRDLDWFDSGWITTTIADVDRQPVLIAKSIRTTNGAELLSTKSTKDQMVQDRSSNKSSVDQVSFNRTTAGQIAKSPSKFYDSTVQVRAEVERILSPKLFTLDEDELMAGPDVLVFVPNPAEEVNDNQTVTVTGKLKKMSMVELENEYGTFDLDPELEVEINNRPIIIANSVKDSKGSELTAKQ